MLFTDEYAKYIAATESKKIYVLVTDYMDTGANDIRGKAYKKKTLVYTFEITAAVVMSIQEAVLKTWGISISIEVAGKPD